MFGREMQESSFGNKRGCRYQLVVISKQRKEAIFGQTRDELAEGIRRLSTRKESDIE